MEVNSMSEKDDKAKQVEQMKEQIEALKLFEEYTDAMMKKEEEASTKTFQELVGEAPKALVTHVPQLNCNINYKGLILADLLELEKIDDDLLRGDEMLFRMWKNGDPSVNRAEFDKLEGYKKNWILEAILRKTPFLLPILPSDLSEKEEDGGKSK
jgi:hypothetical protein